MYQQAQTLQKYPEQWKKYLLAQQQMVQQRALQALLHHQEQSSEAQEASQRIQSQALVALTEVAQQ